MYTPQILPLIARKPKRVRLRQKFAIFVVTFRILALRGANAIPVELQNVENSGQQSVAVEGVLCVQVLGQVEK